MHFAQQLHGLLGAPRRGEHHPDVHHRAENARVGLSQGGAQRRHCCICHGSRLLVAAPLMLF